MAQPTVKRQRLTPHQAEVFARIVWRAGTSRRAVQEIEIGSRTAITHLVEKGYVEVSTLVGPRGGRTRLVWPLCPKCGDVLVAPERRGLPGDDSFYSEGCGTPWSLDLKSEVL